MNLKKNYRWIARRATWELALSAKLLAPKSYKAYWFDNVFNFGDLITKYILEKKLPSAKIVNVNGSVRDLGIALAGAGSLLHELTYPNTLVWGSGFVGDKLPAKRPRRPTGVLAYRGLKTADVADSLGWPRAEAYGDPGVMVPLFHPMSEKKYRVGLVANYRHEPYVGEISGANKKISVRRSVEEVASDIAACEVVISSSLHGLILAQSYGIPSVWIQFPRKLEGDTFKFHDFFSSLGMDALPVSLPEKKLHNSDLSYLSKETIVCEVQKIHALQTRLDTLLSRHLVSQKLPC